VTRGGFGSTINAMPKVAAGVALIALLLARPACSQDARGYAGAGLLWSTQNAATPCEGSSCAKPGVGGSAPGVTAEFGWFVQPAVSLSAEISIPARFEAIQTSGIPTQRYDHNYRDLAISGLVHIQTPAIGPVRAAIVGGGGLVQESTTYRTANAPFDSSTYGPDGDEQTLTRAAWELVAGADLELQLSRRVSVVPEVRMHWISRAPLGVSTGSLALGSLVWRPAIGLRARF
jgi:hypothetical protein